MGLVLKRFSYRFAEEVLNSKLALKNEIEQVLLDERIDIPSMSRPRFNAILKDLFIEKGWESQPAVFNEPGDPSAKMDFLKERLGVEVEFGHSSFIGIDLLISFPPENNKPHLPSREMGYQFLHKPSVTD